MFCIDFETIYQLRNLDKSTSDYEKQKRELKQKLQCFTPAALLETRKPAKIIERTGLMQFDFDNAGISNYDIEELKRAVISLPFIYLFYSHFKTR